MTWLVQVFLDWTYGVVKKFVAELIRQYKIGKEIDEKTKQQAEAVKKAETDDEAEKAAKDILSRRS